MGNHHVRFGGRERRVLLEARPSRPNAEIGQCLLFASIGLEPSIDQSAAYVEGWLKALAEDKRAIFRAASEAQKAVDLITARCGANAPTPALIEEVAA